MEALLLGAVQGVTEFLPISSSAHLLIVSWLLDGQTLPLALNIALHIGTLSAVLFYFWRDWLRLCQTSWSLASRRAVPDEDKHLLFGIFVGSLPAGFLGILFHKEIEAIFHQSPFTSVAPLAFFGVLLWWVDKKAPERLTLNHLTWKQAFWIGCTQAIALIPGSSRSGMTITGGRWLGFQRADATRFSFLLGTPAMGGAALLQSKQLMEHILDPTFVVGVLSSLIVGLLSIHLLLSYVRRFGFLPFAIYRVILAIVLYSI